MITAENKPQLKVVGGVVDKQELSNLMRELRRLGHSETEIMQLLGIKQRSKRREKPKTNSWNFKNS